MDDFLMIYTSKDLIKCPVCESDFATDDHVKWMFSKLCFNDDFISKFRGKVCVQSDKHHPGTKSLTHFTARWDYDDIQEKLIGVTYPIHDVNVHFDFVKKHSSLYYNKSWHELPT